MAEAGVADVLDRCVLRVPEAGGACRLQSKDTHRDFIVREAEVVIAGVRVTVRVSGCTPGRAPSTRPAPTLCTVSLSGWFVGLSLPPSSLQPVLGPGDADQDERRVLLCFQGARGLVSEAPA